MKKISKTIDIFVCKFCGREWNLSENALECEIKCTALMIRESEYKEGDIVKIKIHDPYDSVPDIVEAVIIKVKKDFSSREIVYICNYFDNNSPSGIGEECSYASESEIYSKIDTLDNWKRKYIKAHKLYEEMIEKYPEYDVEIFPEDSINFKITVKEN